MKGSKYKQFNLPYPATVNVIQEVIKQWPTYWHSPSNLGVGASKGTWSPMEKKKEEEVKQMVQRLAALQSSRLNKRSVTLSEAVNSLCSRLWKKRI